MWDAGQRAALLSPPKVAAKCSKTPPSPISGRQAIQDPVPEPTLYQGGLAGCPSRTGGAFFGQDKLFHIIIWMQETNNLYLMLFTTQANKSKIPEKNHRQKPLKVSDEIIIIIRNRADRRKL